MKDLRILKFCCYAAFVLFMVALLTACGGDGTSRAELLQKAGVSEPTSAPQAQISATETPDYQPALVAPTSAPVAVLVQSTPMPEPTAQPAQVEALQIVATIGAACNPYTAQPMPLDEQDKAAGVVVKGAGCIEVRP